MKAYQTQAFAHIVWKILVDPHTDTLAIELRDPDQKQVFFYSLPFLDNKEEPTQIFPPDNWWVGLESCREGIVMLHGYADQSLPIRQGIWAFDLLSGKSLWAQPEIVFSHFTSRGICCSHPQMPDKFILVGLENGAFISDFSEQMPGPVLPANLEIGIPKIYPLSTPEVSPLVQVFKDRTGLVAITQISAFYHKNWTAAYFYSENGDTWDHHLCLFDQEQIIFLHSFPSDDTRPLMDTFFVYKNYLCWIEQSKRLNWLPIT